jgi:putative hemolysin
MLEQERRFMTFGRPAGRAPFGLVELPIEKARAVSAVNRVASRALSLADEAGCFAAGLAELDVEYDLDGHDLGRIPASGPVVVMANHPFGAAQGLIVGDVVTRVRGDARVLGNQLLQEIPQLARWIIPLDVVGGAGAARANAGALRAGLRWLRAGGLLATFPAGAVSHLARREARASDPPWNRHAAALARRSGATVVPVFFEERVGSLLPSELLERRRAKLPVRIGRPIGPDEVAEHEDDAALIDHLRAETYALRRRPA